ncbi:MAG: hypothetical protein HY084_11020 [Gemmatimonadetes bacterium]|nr:hypothetical protein [Gemmatimonadota bacterium]
MPVHYAIDASKRLMVVTAEGTTTAAELFANQDDIRNDPALSPDHSALVDFTGAVEFLVTGDDLRLLVQRAPYSPEVPIALVAHDDLRFGLARMLHTFGESRSARVKLFREHAAALAWIDETRRAR